MNFLSHYYLDRDQMDAWYIAGICTPDLVSIFDRSIRLKKRLLPPISQDSSQAGQWAFYQGILRHFEVDALFHSSDFFREETARISALLRAAFEEGQVSRDYFVSHVLLEILLDRILMEDNPILLDDFYGHLDSIDRNLLRQRTEWATQTRIPRYGSYYDRFIDRKYLYQYVDWDHIIFVLQRILQRVSIDQFEYLYTDTFLKLVQDYEKGLKDRIYGAFQYFSAQLD